ncbi:hypothetical protein HYU22_04885 [Candidatus Woesearchaeota archaeon]|nr:hypothetical protein [Candidatus Woesearchaeota archaeon]
MVFVKRFGIATLLFLFLLTVFSVSAPDGCFVLPESAFYCQTVSTASAGDECSFYPDCVFNETFHPEQDCTQFPECREILCKSSCTTQLAGKCPAGAVPAGEESTWCSPGCCQYSSSGGISCGPVSKKWDCEIGARQQQAAQYRFALLSAPECVSLCQQNVTAFPVEQISRPAETEPVQGSLPMIAGIIIGAGALLVLALIVYRLFRSGTTAPLSIIEKNPRSSWYSFLLPNLKAQTRLQQLKVQHRRAIQEQEREAFLSMFGLTPGVIHSEFSRLQRLIWRHQRAKTPPTAVELFRKLETLTAAVPRSAVMRPLRGVSSSEQEKIIAELRAIIGLRK